MVYNILGVTQVYVSTLMFKYFQALLFLIILLGAVFLVIRCCYCLSFSLTREMCYLCSNKVSSRRIKSKLNSSFFLFRLFVQVGCLESTEKSAQKCKKVLTCPNLLSGFSCQFWDGFWFLVESNVTQYAFKPLHIS